MSEQQNLDVVRRRQRAFSRGDLDGLLSLFDENIEWTSPGPVELPIAGTRKGKQQVAQFFAALDQLLEMQRFEPRTFLADGDRVVVLGDDTARVKATGKTLDGAWAHVFTLKDGKVVSMTEYTDTSALVAELKSVQART